ASSYSAGVIASSSILMRAAQARPVAGSRSGSCGGWRNAVSPVVLRRRGFSLGSGPIAKRMIRSRHKDDAWLVWLLAIARGMDDHSGNRPVRRHYLLNDTATSERNRRFR